MLRAWQSSKVLKRLPPSQNACIPAGGGVVCACVQTFLAVVKGSLERDVVNVLVEHCDHLQLLGGRGAALRVHHEDLKQVRVDEG